MRFADLPRPALRGDFQIQNAAAVIMAMMQLRASLPLSEQDIVKGLQQVALPGRFQYVQQQPAVIVDVAHNPQAARSLSEMLQQTQGSGKTLAVIAMLADKPVAEVIGIMAPVVDEWFSAGLDVPRGMAAETLAKAVKALGTDVKLCTSQTVTQACEQAMQHAGADDRIIVFGSFYTVTEACNYFNRSIAGKG